MTEPGAGGRRFPLGNGTYTLLQMADVLRRAFPEYARKLPRREVPDWMVRLFAFADADVRGNLGELGFMRTTEAREARALLGRELVPAEQAIIATARTVIEHGLVPPA